jgi:hypothetical protein
MPAVSIGLGVASLAAGLAGSAASAAGQAATTEAGYQQAKINQQWQEFEKQMSLTQQRGAMGLQEFDRLFGNQVLERESLTDSEPTENSLSIIPHRWFEPLVRLWPGSKAL